MTNDKLMEIRDMVLQTDCSDPGVSKLADALLLLLGCVREQESRIKSLEDDILTHQHVSGDICAMYTEV
jgi:hypothetical protein